MHIIIVHTVEVGSQHIVPVLAVESERGSISLFVMLGIAGVHVQRPRLLVLLGDDVYHSPRGIAAIKG